ncbi:MAG TPA: hypothetical protein VEF35_04600 [Candidatus Bathyarchaeia archaeon]|nr:hypothetical protein [Candidatus Bathyarchaeia archaeon]
MISLTHDADTCPADEIGEEVDEIAQRKAVTRVQKKSEAPKHISSALRYDASGATSY